MNAPQQLKLRLIVVNIVEANYNLGAYFRERKFHLPLQYTSYCETKYVNAVRRATRDQLSISKQRPDFTLQQHLGVPGVNGNTLNN